jgi:serine/threonine-protein kinase
LIVLLVLAVLGALLWLFARNLLASNEPQTATVPNVVGLSQDQATTKLAELGFKPVIGERRVSQKQPGTVLEQDPKAGALVDNGHDVTLVIARQVQQVTVPPVLGQTVDQARATLQSIGLDIGKVRQQESTQPEGSIIQQTPDAGVKVPKGTPVDVVVATAPSPTPTDIPVTDYTCQPLNHAQDELQKAGFNVVVSPTAAYNPTCPQDNKVAAQSPSSGSAPPGSTITLTPSTKESPTPVAT